MDSYCKVLHFIVVWSIAILRTTDGGSITWFEPPPVETTSINLEELIAENQSIPVGSTNVPLRWNFSLTADATPISLITVILKLNSEKIATIVPPTGQVAIEPSFQGRYSVSWIPQLATVTIFNVTTDDNGEFGCEVSTLEGRSIIWKRKVAVEVVVPLLLTKVSDDQTVLEGSNTTLSCEATGRPKPDITLTRLLKYGSADEILSPPWKFPNISRTASGTYRCTAKNKFENVSQVFKVNVTYPAKIVKLVSKHNVSSQQSVSLDCQAEGNPQPTYSWTPCGSQQTGCHESVLIFEASDKSVYMFTCKVENYLGNDTGNTTLYIASDVINVTLVITGEDCTDGEKLRETIEKIFAGKLGYESVQLRSNRPGSVTVDVALKFSSIVRESEVLSILKDAVKNGEFGVCNVTAITGTRYSGITPTMTTTSTSSSDSTTWIIVGVVVGVVVVLAVAGGVAWHVYKKRKCKKRDSKVHNNGSQGEAGGNVQEEGYVQVNKGYEERANRRSGDGKTSSEPPVLYDTAQTSSRGVVKGPPLPQYAVVDKSKKKPKKPKPGELQYAELGEFSTGQGGQRSSLSPTNRHTETQYADVNAM